MVEGTGETTLDELGIILRAVVEFVVPLLIFGVILVGIGGIMRDLDGKNGRTYWN